MKYNPPNRNMLFSEINKELQKKSEPAMTTNEKWDYEFFVHKNKDNIEYDKHLNALLVDNRLYARMHDPTCKVQSVVMRIDCARMTTIIFLGGGELWCVYISLSSICDVSIFISRVCVSCRTTTKKTDASFGGYFVGLMSSLPGL